MADKSDPGLRLTPTRAAELILDVADPGMWFSKKDIIGPAVDKHRQVGGVDGGKLNGTFKKALKMLCDHQQVEFNGQRGVGAQYRIPIDPEVGPIHPESVTPEAPIPEDSATPTADKIVGSPQSGYVYVICDGTNPSHGMGGAVKIGKSYRPTDQRVSQQILAGVPGTRRCGLIYYTEEPSTYELVLHRLLKASGRHIKGSGGSEWFRSSPEEVERLITILKNLVPQIPS